MQSAYASSPDHEKPRQAVVSQPARKGSTAQQRAGNPEGPEQRKQLLGFLSQKFRKSSNAPDGDSRNHAYTGSVSHQQDPYSDANALPGKPLANYNSIGQPVKAQHSSVLRSLSNFTSKNQ